jgi:hypothetical protein
MTTTASSRRATESCAASDALRRGVATISEHVAPAAAWPSAFLDVLLPPTCFFLAPWHRRTALISIPRAAARRYWAAFRQLLTGVPRRTWPVVQLLADPAGAADRGAHRTRSVWNFICRALSRIRDADRPCELMQTVAEGTGRERAVEPNGADGVVIARWRDGDVPRQAAFDVTSPVVGRRVRVADQLGGTAREFLAALQTLMQVTDPESLRYALNCVQLDGDAGTLTATDGRQILSHSGWPFGLRGRRAGAGEQSVRPPRAHCGRRVRIGQTNSHFVVQAGPWTVWIAMNAGRSLPEGA